MSGLKVGDLVVAPFAFQDNTCEFCQEGGADLVPARRVLPGRRLRRAGRNGPRSAGCDPNPQLSPKRAYVERRTAERKTPREIRRCLKRYIARELYRHLTQSMKPATRP